LKVPSTLIVLDLFRTSMPLSETKTSRRALSVLPFTGPAYLNIMNFTFDVYVTLN
jgi:hypothetical protein